jgi:predicted transcriptional regulator
MRGAAALGPTPAERSRAIAAMCEKKHYREVARELGMSSSHVRNYVRLTKRLAPPVFDLFAKAGHGARLRDWLELCGLDAEAQATVAKELVK